MSENVINLKTKKAIPDGAADLSPSYKLIIGVNSPIDKNCDSITLNLHISKQSKYSFNAQLAMQTENSMLA